MKKFGLFVILLIFASLACSFPSFTPIAAPSSTPLAVLEVISVTATAPSPSTNTPAPTVTIVPTVTATITVSPTITDTPEPSATPTLSVPFVTVNMQAHCRYGPNIAYLHAADLFSGDVGIVRGRFRLSKWLLVKFDKLGYVCWVAPSVVNITGDITTIGYSEVFLPGPSVLYKAPKNVDAVRHGSKVTISWDAVQMTADDDQGYLLDIFVCQGGGYLWYPVALADHNMTDYTIKDEKGCPAPSGGKLYAVEKHGYTRAVEIDWPQP